MAHGKYITAEEADVIRVGVHLGFKAPRIAKALGRNRVTIHNHIKKMEAEGTLGNLPMAFLVEAIGNEIRAAGARK